MRYTLDFIPVNTVLLVYILYSVQNIFKPGYSWLPKAHPPAVMFKTYTPKTVEPFSGKNGARILLAINGIVFDVTARRNFYGSDGMYGNFAGRDASRGMAKQSFDMDTLTPID
ncbi:cytochrome b5 [Rhizopogon vinicolor AM-OR11-026]|uniref:Cytochrome b5 n=1 Tax=Rhizopogon vinicolor AM-OR11-026 TaxID=1314800 RepID=A0A1B7MU74_9AGAM|nr:cytochrome b5 [Rhizopogon vinicolor AM-OR11-026]